MAEGTRKDGWTMRRRLLGAAILLALLGAPAGAAERVRLMLDWTPNVDHVPLFWAREKGLFAREGLEVEILTPSDTADPLKLAAVEIERADIDREGGGADQHRHRKGGQDADAAAPVAR